jgi:drug/metabolite transporter (DMT)-like permease
VGVGCALLAALFAASAYLSIKVLTRTDTPIAIVWWFSAIGTMVSSVAAIDGTVPLSGSLMAQLVAIGVLGAFAQWALTRAYAEAPAAKVSVYAYSTPVFAYLTGMFVLGEIPRITSVVGAALVVAAGVIAARESS